MLFKTQPFNNMVYNINVEKIVFISGKISLVIIFSSIFSFGY